VIDHETAHELIAAFVLDAVPRIEYEHIAAHLDQCPRCREERDALQGVAAAMANSVEPLPGGLWSRISSQLPDRKDQLASPVPARWRNGLSREPRSESSFWCHPLRSTRGRATTVATLGVATAAITAVLGLDVVNDAHHIAQLRNGMGVPTHSAVATALRTPGHKIATLRDSDDSESALFVIVPDGRGYLMASELPVLSTKQTYQLWGTIGDRTISLGILGREPHQVTFTMSGSPRPSRLGISVEPTGGSIQPSSGMLASGPI